MDDKGADLLHGGDGPTQRYLLPGLPEQPRRPETGRCLQVSHVSLLINIEWPSPYRARRVGLWWAIGHLLVLPNGLGF